MDTKLYGRYYEYAPPVVDGVLYSKMGHAFETSRCISSIIQDRNTENGEETSEEVKHA